MPELVKQGHVYIAQPPLYKLKRKKREEYIENDDQMSKILIELGSEDARLFRLKDKREFAGQQLVSVLESLQELAKLVDTIERRGIKFEDYLAARDEKRGNLPAYAVRVKEEGVVRFEFARNDKELAKLTEKIEENLDEIEDDKAETGTNGKSSRTKVIELYESAGIQSVIETLAKKGFDIDHYATQEDPLYELAEGATVEPVVEGKIPVEGPAPSGSQKGDKSKPKSKLTEKRTPVRSIPEILDQIKEIGKRGLVIQRYKGLGEMNPEQLWETTMDPERRKMLKVEVRDAADADTMFTILMGDEVEPRRQFIEDNALNVRNLDV
jgi:DNA gyrase subunit B